MRPEEVTENNINNNSTKTFLEVFGFVSNQAKRNLVIFFFVLLVFSNIFLMWMNIRKDAVIQKLNDDRVEITRTMSDKVTEEVRRQVAPISGAIIQAANRVDSAALKLDSNAQNQLIKKHK